MHSRASAGRWTGRGFGDRKAGQVRYWQYGQAEKSPDLAISVLSRFLRCCPASSDGFSMTALRARSRTSLSPKAFRGKTSSWDSTRPRCASTPTLPLIDLHVLVCPTMVPPPLCQPEALDSKLPSASLAPSTSNASVGQKVSWSDPRSAVFLSNSDTAFSLYYPGKEVPHAAAY